MMKGVEPGSAEVYDYMLDLGLSQSLVKNKQVFNSLTVKTH